MMLAIIFLPLEERQVLCAVKKIYRTAFNNCSSSSLISVMFCNKIEEFMSCPARRYGNSSGGIRVVVVHEKSMSTYCFFFLV
jgi:hypothetical protein